MALGAEKMVIRDLQAQFVNEIVWRAVQCNAIYVSRASAALSFGFSY